MSFFLPGTEAFDAASFLSSVWSKTGTSESRAALVINKSSSLVISKFKMNKAISKNCLTL